MQRAVAQDPSLVQQYPELASHVAKNEAEAAKELGNKEFSEKRCVLPSMPLQIFSSAPPTCLECPEMHLRRSAYGLQVC